MEIARGAVDLGAARDAYAGGQFAPVEKEAVGFGMTQTAFWLRLSVANNSTQPGTWVLETGKPFLKTAEVYLEMNGSTVPLIKDSDRSPFSNRVVPDRLLYSPDLTLPAQSSTVLWVHFAADGAATLPLKLTPADTFRRAQVEASVQLAVFYTAGMVMIVFIFAFAGILRSRVAFLYAGFFTSLLAYNAQLEGVLFALAWPGFPGWNAVASHPIGLIAIAFASLMGRAFLSNTNKHRVLKVLLVTNASAASLYMFAPLVLPLITVKVFAGIFVLAFLLLQTTTAIVALKNRYVGSGYFFLGTMILLLYLGLFTASSQIAGLFPGWSLEAFMRFGQLLDGTVFAAAVITQAWALRREENEARLMAEFRRQQLAETTHDIRQPLLSLRLMLEKLPNDTANLPASAAAGLKQALSYLDGIVSRDLEAARPMDGAHAHVPTESSSRETFDVSLILTNAGLMFEEEARAKGLRLTIAPSSASVTADPVALLRAVTNLVANAVQHTRHGRVLVGARRQKATIAIEVWDTGVGLAPKDIERIRQPYESSDESRGEGLGLHLVEAVSQKQGWALEIDSQPGKGSVFRITGISIAT